MDIKEMVNKIKECRRNNQDLLNKILKSNNNSEIRNCCLKFKKSTNIILVVCHGTLMNTTSINALYTLKKNSLKMLNTNSIYEIKKLAKYTLSIA